MGNKTKIALNIFIIIMIFTLWCLASAIFISLFDFIAGTDYFSWRFSTALGITLCLVNAFYRWIFCS